MVGTVYLCQKSGLYWSMGSGLKLAAIPTMAAMMIRYLCQKSGLYLSMGSGRKLAAIPTMAAMMAPLPGNIQGGCHGSVHFFSTLF